MSNRHRARVIANCERHDEPGNVLGILTLTDAAAEKYSAAFGVDGWEHYCPGCGDVILHTPARPAKVHVHTSADGMCGYCGQDTPASCPMRYCATCPSTCVQVGAR